MTINGLLAAGIIVLALALLLVIMRWRSAQLEAARLASRLRETGTDLTSKQAWTGGEAIGEAAYNALLLIDSSRHVIHLNPAARRLFGLESSAASQSVMAVTRHHELDDLVRMALANGELLEQQIEFQGHLYRARAAVYSPQSDKQSGASGSYHGIIISLALEDVSELQRLGRARRDMVANISHELRTPITSIRLLVDTLKRSTLSNRKQRDAILAKIDAETEVLQQITQELLDLAMIESGRFEMRFIEAALRSISQRAIQRLSEQSSRKHLTVDDNIPANLVVLADLDQIERVFVNLLHNAIKFTPDGGRIGLTATSDAEWATLSVEDTGPGIPAADRERIFERFYRANRSRSGEGTGLGLAIAKHIITAHGGQIWVESRAHGQGARFCLTMPLPDDASSASS